MNENIDADLANLSKEDLKKLKKLESKATKKVKERQRRSKMTQTIEELRQIIPSCYQDKKINQSLVMRYAVDYINELQNKIKQLEEEIRILKSGTFIKQDDNNNNININYGDEKKSIQEDKIKEDLILRQYSIDQIYNNSDNNINMNDMFINDIEDVGIWPLYPHSNMHVDSNESKTNDDKKILFDDPFVYCECGKMCQSHTKDQINDFYPF